MPWPRIGLAVVLVAYLAIAATYNLNTPLFEAPDEIWHYLYVRNLSEGRGLPRDDGRGAGLLSQQEAAQPPLYYAVAAALTFWAPRGDINAIVHPNVAGSRGDPTTDGNKNLFLHPSVEQFPWRGEVGTVRLVRLTTTLWGALTIVMTYLTGRALFRSAVPALAAAAVVALTPEFLFMSSAVSNDVAVAGAGSLLLYASTRAAQLVPSRRWAIFLGLAGGAVILTKPIAVGALVLIPLSIWICARRHAESPRDALVRLGLAAIAVGVSCGWWFAYNWRTYRSPLPVQSFLSREDLFAQMPSLGSFIADLSGLRYSYWAFFGWFSIPVPGQYYQYYDVLLVLGLVGAGALLVKDRLGLRGDKNDVVLVGLALPLALVVTVVAGVFAYRMIVLAFHGRLVLGAVSAISLLLVVGWTNLAPRRVGTLIGVGMAASLAVPAVLFPWTVLRPAYRPPRLLEVASVHPQNPLSATFSSQIRLLGVDVEPGPDSRVRAGDDAWVTVYLEGLRQPATDYLLFLKVVDPAGFVVAEVNSHPGRGTYPTSEWVPGSVFADRYRVHLPRSASGPSVDRLFLGFYRLDSQENLPVVADDGTPLGSSVRIGVVVVSGPPSGGQVAAGQPFREGTRDILSLVDLRIGTRSVRAGSPIEGTLVFAGLARPVSDYTIFVHLENAGKLVAQDDSPPLRGNFPTSYWKAGDIVEHPWKMQIPADAPTGDYTLTVGWYDPKTGERLGTATGSSLDLGVIRVE